MANIVVLIGRLTANPELRFTQSGKAVTSFTLAVNRRFDREKADFFKVTVWGKQAEATAQYVKKGQQVAIQGRVEINQYTDKDGNNRYSTDVVAEQVEFLGGGQQGKETHQTVIDDESFPVVDDSEDIPF